MSGNIYLTSDLHFAHRRSFLYEPRGFSSIEEHDKAIIKNWNEIVKDNDVVWVLGDLMLNDNKYGIECLKQLKGEIHFLIGNHEGNIRPKLYEEIGFINEGFANILKYKKWHFYLSHYRTDTGNFDDDKSLRQRTFNLAGHTHASNKFYEDMPLCYNVCLDAHENKPVLIDDIIEDIRSYYGNKMDCKQY